MLTKLVPKVFGHVHFVHIYSHGQGTLDPRAVKCLHRIFRTQKGYKCYNPSTYKTYVSADATFVEQESYLSYPYL